MVLPVRSASKDLLVQLDNPELEAFQEVQEHKEPQVGLVSLDSLDSGVSPETPDHLDGPDLLGFREPRDSLVTLERAVTKVRKDHKVHRVSLDPREVLGRVATKVSLEILDPLDQKDLKEDPAQRVSQSFCHFITVTGIVIIIDIVIIVASTFVSVIVFHHKAAGIKIRLSKYNDHYEVLRGVECSPRLKSDR